MSDIKPFTRIPFPLNSYASYEIVDGEFIVNGNEVIGIMGTPFPSSNLDDISTEDVERLLKAGFTIKGYSHYSLNNNGILVKPCELYGYPDNSVTCDIYGLLYYENVCIGLWDHDSVEAAIHRPDEYQTRLDDLGIQSNYMYGVDSHAIQIHRVMVNYDTLLYMVMGYSLHVASELEELNDKMIITYIEGTPHIIGQVIDGKIEAASTELIEKYGKLNIKPPIKECIDPLLGTNL